MDPNKVKPVIRVLIDANDIHHGSSRLRYSVHPVKTSIDYPRLAEEIKAAGDNHQFVLDSSFFPRHEIDDRLWDAILQQKIFITRHVWEEL